jgi:YihY family inner membrane protein
VNRLKAAFDAFQQRHTALAFSVGVAKKHGEDGAGHLAALVAYFAFFSIFPLLLVLVTVTGIVLRHDPALQARLVNSALAQFPVVGDQIGKRLEPSHRTGLALVIGLTWSFFGARSMASMMREAADRIWQVPYVRRSGFPTGVLRDLALLVAVAVGLAGTTLLTGFLAAAAGPMGTMIGLATSLVLNFGAFLLAFRLATSRDVDTSHLILPSTVAAVGWQVLQLAGTWLVARQVSRASDVYGTFAIVIGLLTWLYLAALIAVTALEIGVVRAEHLWPRSVFTPPFTPADEDVLANLAREQTRSEGEIIDVGFAQPPARGRARGA